MSVDQASVIDFVGVDKESGEAVLTISDHLDWRDSDAHLHVLEEKINRYVAFVESGEVWETVPLARDQRVRIDVVHKFAPPEQAKAFYRYASEALQAAGIALSYRVKTVGEA